MKGATPHPDAVGWIGMAKTVPSGAGVYCVWVGEEVVYIGSSGDMQARLRSHNNRGSFISAGADRITWMKLPNEDRIKLQDHYFFRLAMERWLIRKHRPRFNAATWHPRADMLIAAGGMIQ